MVDIDRQAALRALDAVRDPKSGQGLAAAGLVQGLVISGGKAGFMLEIEPADAALYAPVREAAERALSALPGIATAQVVLIAVASGKGGVGKSTVSVNLAVALARLGLSVGLLDADVYGPSVPKMMGASGEPKFVDGKLQALRAHGVKLMSIGLLIDEDKAAIWRGPMASSAVRQLAYDVAWGSEDAPLDVLVCDLPPGTGDIQLTLVQKLKIDGVVVVSTPQEIALIDARRAVAMFGRTEIPILGMIENMAFFADPSTGARIHIFGDGGARAEALTLGIPLLAEVPIDIALRVGADEGRPAAPESAAGKALDEAAQALKGLLSL